MSAPSVPNFITVVAGDCWDLPFQCVVRGKSADAVFGANDLLQAFVYQGKSTTPLFSPAVLFYTANGTHGRYQQGQV
jgi:hypothetical protein